MVSGSAQGSGAEAADVVAGLMTVVGLRHATTVAEFRRALRALEYSTAGRGAEHQSNLCLSPSSRAASRVLTERWFCTGGGGSPDHPQGG